MPRKAEAAQEAALFDLAIALFEDGSLEKAQLAFDISYGIMMTTGPGRIIAWNAWLNMTLHFAKMSYEGKQPNERVRKYIASGWYRLGIDYAFIDSALGLAPGDAAYELEDERPFRRRSKRAA